jgi:hypothetical protein
MKAFAIGVVVAGLVHCIFLTAMKHDRRDLEAALAKERARKAANGGV